LLTRRECRAATRRASRSYPQPVETVDLQLIQLPAVDDLNELSPVPAGLDGRNPWWARELLAKLHADSARNPKARVGRRETLAGLSDRGWGGDLRPEVRARRVRPAFR